MNLTRSVIPAAIVVTGAFFALVLVSNFPRLLPNGVSIAFSLAELNGPVIKVSRTPVHYDVAGARRRGMPDDRILTEIMKKKPKFDTAAALQSGYTKPEIVDYLTSPQSRRIHLFSVQVSTLAAFYLAVISLLAALAVYFRRQAPT